jgi:site-specific DNA-methyltransferase (adenine-specific)/adenine-specific DNA-methyltransferase
LVLDSFAGSGTTGHAVLKQNAEDGGTRRFILVEMDENICQNITAERLKRVALGYTYKDQNDNEKQETGLGGGFRYCELGETLFDAQGQIRQEVTFEDLARHVYFTETGQPLPEKSYKQWPLLGVKEGVAVYLLYNGILKDKSAKGGNVLTRAVLASLPKHAGPKVIYGNGTLFSESKLRELGITFKQAPYEIKIT